MTTRVEKGIVKGCTISPILFIIGMGMVTRAAEIEGAKDGLRDFSTTVQRLYGRSYSDNNNTYTGGGMCHINTGR